MDSTSPPLVYLDSQDYSRFGDVLRGKGDAQSETVYRRLLELRAAGDARFAYSMPILAELLQFDERHPETSFKKAEAVEALCGGNALAYPGRLAAIEVATVAFNAALISARPAESVQSDDGYWYPNVANELEGLRDRLKSGMMEELAQTSGLNRAARRAAKKQTRSLDLAAAVAQAGPEFAAQYSLPPTVVGTSLVPLLRGQISSAQASRRLFSAVASPTTFVNVYFRRYEGEKTLPFWMRDVGVRLQASIEKLKNQFAPFLAHERAISIAKQAMSENEPKLRASLLVLARSDVEYLGVSQEVVDIIAADPRLVEQVPMCRATSAIVNAYALQTTGLQGQAAKIEHSFGGDVVHALYLSHVNLWRGDRRFSHLVRECIPVGQEKVVSKLADLPEAILTVLRDPSPMAR